MDRSMEGSGSGRGVGTGMLSLWEEVVKDARDGRRVVALAFIDVSAGFDSVPHVNLLRKLQAIGYDGKALKWLRERCTKKT